MFQSILESGGAQLAAQRQKIGRNRIVSASNPHNLTVGQNAMRLSSQVCHSLSLTGIVDEFNVSEENLVYVPGKKIDSSRVVVPCPLGTGPSSRRRTRTRTAVRPNQVHVRPGFSILR